MPSIFMIPLDEHVIVTKQIDRKWEGIRLVLLTMSDHVVWMCSGNLEGMIKTGFFESVSIIPTDSSHS
jgi:hypothetical protein